MSKRKPTIHIDGHQASLLLFALDEMMNTDALGKVRGPYHEYSKEYIQRLRDRLFALHEHVPEGSVVR